MKKLLFIDWFTIAVFISGFLLAVLFAVRRLRHRTERQSGFEVKLNRAEAQSPGGNDEQERG